MSSHQTFKVGTTAGSFSVVIAAGLGATIDSAEAVLNAIDQNGNNVVDAADAEISAVTTAGDGTKGATITADVPPELTAVSGFYWLEFVITYADDSVQKYPTVPGFFTAEVFRSFEAEPEP
jgi:hypothetical protein